MITTRPIRLLQTLVNRWKYILIPLAAPLAIIALTDFRSLLAIWNQGRGGFLIALSFMSLESLGLGSRQRIGNERVIIILATLLSTAYFGSTSLGLHNWLARIGEGIGVSLSLSWVAMWDYVIFSIFLLIILAINYKREIRLILSANVYLAGMAALLSLDALFPFDKLGPLQGIVPFLLGGAGQLVTIFGLGEITLTGNIMTLYGSAGTFSFAVFWPSAGVHSMIIYSLIVTIFLLKFEFTFRRKLGFLFIGIVGTFAVNIFRIFLLSAYVLIISTNPSRFEDFHNVIGEIVFLPWIMGYIFLIYRFAR